MPSRHAPRSSSGNFSNDSDFLNQKSELRPLSSKRDLAAAETAEPLVDNGNWRDYESLGGTVSFSHVWYTFYLLDRLYWNILKHNRISNFVKLQYLCILRSVLNSISLGILTCPANLGTITMPLSWVTFRSVWKPTSTWRTPSLYGTFGIEKSWI